MSHWVTKYIGIPYSLGEADWTGVDCWGLVRLAYQSERGVLLPTLTELLVRDNRTQWKEIEKPEEMCVVALSQKRAIHHFGIWTNADRGKVIHAFDNHSVVADTIRGIKLRGFTTMRFYQYGTYY